MILLASTLWAILISGLPAWRPPDGPEAIEIQRANQKLFHRAAEAVAPSIVRIETVGGSQPTGGGPVPQQERRPFQDAPGSGFRLADGPTTGIVYSADGYILTSSFNFVRDPLIITVVLPDGRRLVAELVGRDQVRKLALLKVEAQDLPVPPWVERGQIRVGQWCLALGRAFGGDEPFVSVGIISALHRMMDNAIQTDAKLSPGNYGGPLIDTDGKVLGICVPMAQRPGELAGVEMYDAGVGFALPMERVETLVAALRAGQNFYRGWLGMTVDPEFPEGVRVGAVAEPSPLQSAGVRAGDQIIKVNESVIEHFGHLVQALYMRPAGEEVTVRIRRDGEEFDKTVRLARSEELGELPETPPPFDPSAPLPDAEEEPQP
jgi:serine protease Do